MAEAAPPRLGPLWIPVNALQWVGIILITVLGAILALLTLLLPGQLGPRFVQPGWGRLFLAICGARLRVEGGADIDPAEPHIFLANHNSWLDIPVLLVSLPVPLRFISKDSVRWMPLVGLYMWLSGMIFINRGDRDKAQASLARAGHRIRKGLHIIAFPEGTRSRDGRLQPLKKGPMVLALEAQVPVLPVAVSGTRDLLPRASLAIRPGEVVVRIGAPIPTAGRGYEHRNELRAEVSGALAGMLGDAP